MSDPKMKCQNISDLPKQEFCPAYIEVRRSFYDPLPLMIGQRKAEGDYVCMTPSPEINDPLRPGYYQTVYSCNREGEDCKRLGVRKDAAHLLDEKPVSRCMKFPRLLDDVDTSKEELRREIERARKERAFK